ncbi:hypothetical protein [Oleiphilus sp. HI0067]|nr:hypothetical protein [Oleiphilus sp. HI0067]
MSFAQDILNKLTITILINSDMSNVYTIIKLLALTLIISGCATSFDRTNIRPGERVYGPAVSVVVPTEKSWFAVDYGTGNRIKLSQLNYDDSYSLKVAVNRGPAFGMFESAQAHLSAYRENVNDDAVEGLIVHGRDSWAAEEYGNKCITYAEQLEDWRGRNNAGPALVDVYGLVCPHRGLPNILVNVELSRRYEVNAPRINVQNYAEQVFKSIEYAGVD